VLVVLLCNGLKRLNIHTDKETSNPKQPSCKKGCGPPRCEIQSGGQEMAMMIG